MISMGAQGKAFLIKYPMKLAFSTADKMWEDQDKSSGDVQVNLQRYKELQNVTTKIRLHCEIVAA